MTLDYVKRTWAFEKRCPYCAVIGMLQIGEPLRADELPVEISTWECPDCLGRWVEGKIVTSD